MPKNDKVPSYPDLAGRVAVVTAGSGGIGAAACRLLAAHSAKAVLNGRDLAKINDVVDKIQANCGTAAGVAADCTDPVQRLRQRTEEEFGPADVLAAFAGGGQARPGPVTEVSEQDWQSTKDGSLTATFLALKSPLPDMMQRGQGAILTVASSAARLSGLGAPAPYVAAKAGVIALTRQAAAEAGRQGVRAYCLVWPRS